MDRTVRICTGTRTRDEGGSIAIVMVIMMVASSLTLMLVSASDAGLRSSRRAGDSANALQLADAGLNDAVKSVASSPTSSITSDPVSLGASGSYSYIADLDPTASVWHVTSTGTDPRGVKRVIKADAVAESLFGSALFVQSSLSIPAGGTLDSFSNGLTKANMCTKHGTVGTNSGQLLDFKTNGTTNCQDWAHDNGWSSPVDGCVSYADSDPPTPETGSGKCPSSNTQLRTPAFVPPQVVGPGTVATPPVGCSSSTPALKAPLDGSPYFWTSIVLRSGCKIDPTNGPVVIYTSGVIDIGDATGSSGTVNEPYAIGGLCGASTYTAGLKDKDNNPSRYYCPGWAGKLRLYMLSGSNNTVILRNHVKFWGIINAPSACLACVGATGNSGTPQAEAWGAIITSTANSQAQVSLHYDDSLADLSTGRYTLQNWREEKSG